MSQSLSFFSIAKFTVFLLLFFSCHEVKEIELKKGLVIRESVTIKPQEYLIKGERDLKKPVIKIEGEDITVDFQGATLNGATDKAFPNEYYGLGFEIKGKNISIKNLHLRGFRVGIQAKDSEKLTFQNCNINYNFRCRFTGNNRQFNNCISLRSAENKNKVLPLAAGIQIENCKDITIFDNHISYNNLGLFIDNSDSGKIYNNTIQFNGSSGVVFNNASNISLMQNQLDWNRHYGVQSASQVRKNIIAYNSMTHCGSNLFSKDINFKNDLFPQEWINPKADSLEKIYLPILKNWEKPNFNFKGKDRIFKDEWSIYNFQHPAIWLREVNDDKYTFAIFGPEGNWKIVDGKGFIKTSRQSGATPATIVATKPKDYNGELRLDLEFIGVEFTDQFGRKNKRGKTFKFGFNNN